jgi:integrase
MASAARKKPAAKLRPVKPAAKRRPVKPARAGKRRCRRTVGQADKLPGAAWTLWTHHVQATGPSWLYPVVCFGHLLCLRVTEVLRLCCKDFDLEKGVVRVQALKRQGAIDKCMSEAAVQFVRKLQEEGISVNRPKNTGLRGKQDMMDVWHWPKEPEDYLFPASRRDSQQKNRGKDVVARAIRSARRTFQVPHIPEVQPNRIRSHSGRHRCINDMKQHNVEREVGNKFARIADDGVYERYGKLSAQQAGKKLQQNQDLQVLWKQMY